MKKLLTPAIVTLLLLYGRPHALTAQKTAGNIETTFKAAEGERIYNRAKTLNEQAKGTESDISKKSFNNNQDKKIADLILKGLRISQQAEAAGPKMPKEDAEKFDRQMQMVTAELDKLTGENSAGGKDSGKCFGGCDNQYKGWGGGKGWNRFWCKASCFTVKVSIS